MTERRLLHAVTLLCDRPPYLNISQYEDGTVEVTVRGTERTRKLDDGKEYLDTGDTASIKLTAEQFQAMFLETSKNFRS